jgi:hypothetical protein
MLLAYCASEEAAAGRLPTEGRKGARLPEELLEAETFADLRGSTDVREYQVAERRVRSELRRQIALLERRLAELFAAAFPRQGIEWRAGGAGGPRVLGVADLERVRDALAMRLRAAESEVARRGRIEERNRVLLEEMIADPQHHRGLVITAGDIGEPSCRTWRSVPRLGLVGMLMGWWRVVVSSGCPLAAGAGGVISGWAGAPAAA